MSLQRIRIKDVGAADGTAYTFTINPSAVDLSDDDDMKLLSVIDGAPVRMVSTFDDRSRKMRWSKFPSAHANFSALVSVLKSYKGDDKEINFGTVDYASFGWRQIHIDNVAITTEDGGDLKLNMELTFHYIAAY